MCGIVYAERWDDRPANKQVAKRYRKQKTRGQDGFGFIGLDSTGKVTTFKRYMEEKEALSKLETLAHSRVLFHHRYPTSTPNVPESAHPILVSHPELAFDYYVVHNGIIMNDAELKEQHDKLGYKYNTSVQTTYKATNGKQYVTEEAFNDSEAFAIELVRNIEGLAEYCGAEGPIAYIALQVGKANKQSTALYYGTNGGNPLTVTTNSNGFIIASEGGTAIAPNVSHRIDMDTGERVKANQIRLMPYKYPKSTPYSPSKSTTGLLGASSYAYDEEGYRPYDYENYDSVNQRPYIMDYSDMEPEDLLNEMSKITTAIQECSADISIARQADAKEEEEELRIELKGLTEQRQYLGQLYEKREPIAF